MAAGWAGGLMDTGVVESRMGGREEGSTELEVGIVACVLPKCVHDSTFSVLFYL